MSLYCDTYSAVIRLTLAKPIWSSAQITTVKHSNYIYSFPFSWVFTSRARGQISNKHRREKLKCWSVCRENNQIIISGSSARSSSEMAAHWWYERSRPNAITCKSLAQNYWGPDAILLINSLISTRFGGVLLTVRHGLFLFFLLFYLWFLWFFYHQRWLDRCDFFLLSLFVLPRMSKGCYCWLYW